MKKYLILLIIAFSFIGHLFAQPADILTAESYYLKGKEFLDKGDYQQADEYFKKAQGILNTSTGSYPPADFSAAAPVAASNPKQNVKPVDNPKDIYQEANKQYLAGNWDIAANLYKQLILQYSNKNSDIYYNLAIINLKQTDYVAAIVNLERVVKLNPRDAQAHYNLGVLYDSYINDEKKAREHYRKYLIYSPADTDKVNVAKWAEELKKKNLQ